MPRLSRGWICVYFALDVGIAYDGDLASIIYSYILKRGIMGVSGELNMYKLKNVSVYVS